MLFKYMNDIQYTEHFLNNGIAFSSSGNGNRILILDSGGVYIKNKIIGPTGMVKYRDDENRNHRSDGPAVIWSDGKKEYWINGRKIEGIELFVLSGNY